MIVSHLVDLRTERSWKTCNILSDLEFNTREFSIPYTAYMSVYYIYYVYSIPRRIQAKNNKLCWALIMYAYFFYYSSSF